SRGTKGAMSGYTRVADQKRTSPEGREVPETEMVCLREPVLLDWNDDRLAFLCNKEIDSPRPFCRVRVPDEVNSLVRIGAERPRFHHVGRAAFRLMSQRTLEHVKKFRSRMIVLRAYRSRR